MRHKSLTVVLWPLYALTLLISATLIAWHLLAQFDFAYSSAYKLLKIDDHISEFAPQNRYRQGFELTSREEHFRLFSEIVASVQSNGKGLADIAYYHDGTSSPLLREAEVRHLQTVARLITSFYWLGSVSIGLSIILLLLIRHFRPARTKLKSIVTGIVALALALTVMLLIVGPKSTFHWFHALIFPKGDQWFFYYQDSLMTTLMKAPDLFGFMGGLLAVVTLVLYYCLLQISSKLGRVSSD